MSFTIREVHGKKKFYRKDISECFSNMILNIEKDRSEKLKIENRNSKYEIFMLELYF